MPLDPRLNEFWQSEKRKLSDELADILLPILLAGAQSGFAALPKSIADLTNIDRFNQAAIDFLMLYRLALVEGLTDTTRQNVITLIDNWIRSGEPITTLEKQIGALPAFSANRARAVAVTEITRLYAQGNILAWQATGFITGKRWMTANDERVCPLCGPLHMQIVEINTDFSQSIADVALSPQMQALVKGNEQRAARRAATLLRNADMSVNGPPRHVNCRCWLQPFVDVEAVGEMLG